MPDFGPRNDLTFSTGRVLVRRREGKGREHMSSFRPANTSVELAMG